MCEEESDDAEAVAKLLQISDSIGRTIERYRLVKKGDVEGAARIPKGTLGTTTGVSKNANNEFSLIDFDPEPDPDANGESAQAGGGGAAHGATSLEDDLLGLSFGDRPQTGPVALELGMSPDLHSPSVHGYYNTNITRRCSDGCNPRQC
jgi:ADP-ribosylation factor-binding protein GGA